MVSTGTEQPIIVQAFGELQEVKQKRRLPGTAPATAWLGGDIRGHGLVAG